MTNKTELPNLDRLEALARAATPGPWAYQEDSDAYTHIVRPVASPGWIIASATQTSKPEGEANGRWIAAANPAAVLALIQLARRAQPEGEARCVICGSAEPRTGTCGSDDPRALCKASGKPEGEAPQADTPAPSAAAMDDVVDNLREYASNAGYSHNDYQDTMRQAANTIEALRAQLWHWGPFAAQQAAAPGALESRGLRPLCRECNGRGLIGLLTSLRCNACSGTGRVAAAPGAPGTPEAPGELPRLYRFDCYIGKTKMAAGVGVHATSMAEAEEKAKKLADKEETVKFDSNQPCHPSRKCSICAEYERAAQLYGGQEGSKS